MKKQANYRKILENRNQDALQVALMKKQAKVVEH